MSLILGIESTCDETAAAVVRDGREVLSNVVATQYDLHAKFRGVVPEIASRAHIENILPVLQEAMGRAGVTARELDAVAIAHRPGLIGSLLIGVTAAKTLAWSWGKPLIAIDHIQAHLYSGVLGTAEIPQPTAEAPFAGAVFSGGHTALYRLNSWTDITLLGGTIDDALGEAYDKVAAMLGLPFPGGPHLARLAEVGNPTRHAFPRSLFERESLDMSLSGLKTAVLYTALGKKGLERKASDLTETEKADVAASFQAACLDVLEEKLRRLLKQTRSKTLLLGGGVSSNTALRVRLEKLPARVILPQKEYCTDNAAMSAGLAHLHYVAGNFAPLTLDAVTSSSIPLAP